MGINKVDAGVLKVAFYVLNMRVYNNKVQIPMLIKEVQYLSI